MRNKLFVSAFILMGFVPLNAEEADLRLSSNLDCSKLEYCVTIDLKSSDPIGFGLGTSSVMLEYDKKAMKFKSYESLNFDENGKCLAGGHPAYAKHQYDALTPGVFNTTITLNFTDKGCPYVQDEYIEVAEVCFAILNPSRSSDVRVCEKHTNFNIAKENKAVVEHVNTTTLDEILYCNGSDLGYDESIQMYLDINPVDEIANLGVVSDHDDVMELGIFDLNGRLLEVKTLEITQGIRNEVLLNVEGLPSGMYVLKNLNNIRQKELKLIKK